MSNVVQFRPRNHRPEPVDEPGLDWIALEEAQNAAKAFQKEVERLEKTQEALDEGLRTAGRRADTGLWFIIGALLGLSF